MNDWLYAGATILGTSLALNTILVAAAEYRNRRLSDGKVGVIYFDGESDLREPFVTLLDIAEPVLDPLRVIVLCAPGEYLGERVYRWKHPKQNVVEPPPTTVSSDSK